MCQFIDHQVNLPMNLKKLNLTLELVSQKNPFLKVVIGDVNGRSSKYCAGDKTTQKCLKIENLLSKFALSQVINKPTHIFQNLNACIDLLFTNQQNLTTDSDIHPSHDANYYRQIIFGKFNLKINLSSPYEKQICH